MQTLVSELDELFPVINPGPETDMNTIMYRAGQRSVVEWIRDNIED